MTEPASCSETLSEWWLEGERPRPGEAMQAALHPVHSNGLNSDISSIANVLMLESHGRRGSQRHTH